jgi:hypothetical protein
MIASSSQLCSHVAWSHRLLRNAGSQCFWNAHPRLPSSSPFPNALCVTLVKELKEAGFRVWHVLGRDTRGPLDMASWAEVCPRNDWGQYWKPQRRRSGSSSGCGKPLGPANRWGKTISSPGSRKPWATNSPFVREGGREIARPRRRRQRKFEAVPFLIFALPCGITKPHVSSFLARKRA